MKNRPKPKGLPANVDAERVILGAILMDESHFSKSAAELHTDDFSLRQHQQIFRRMKELHAAGLAIDRITVANELMKYGEFEPVGGMSFIVSLDEGLPDMPHIDNYVQIVRDHAALRKVVLLGNRAADMAALKEYPPIKILTDLGKAVESMRVSATPQKDAYTPMEIVDKHGGIDAFINSLKPGISTGFPKIDDAILGLQAGCHYIIAGRTGSGKTALAENISVHVARAGHPVAFFSLEMSKEILLARAICCEASLPFKAYIRNQIDAEGRQRAKHALEELSELPLYILDRSSLTADEFESMVDYMVTRHKIWLTVLDYLQIVNAAPGMREFKEYQTVTAASQRCRLVARKHGIRSIAISQLSRPVDKRKPDAQPQLAELKASGGIENDAQAVLLVHRPEMYKPSLSSLKGRADILIAKNRVGSLGTVPLEFRGMFMRFQEPAAEPPHAYQPGDDHDEDDD